METGLEQLARETRELKAKREAAVIADERQAWRELRARSQTEDILRPLLLAQSRRPDEYTSDEWMLAYEQALSEVVLADTLEDAVRELVDDDERFIEVRRLLEQVPADYRSLLNQRMKELLTERGHYQYDPKRDNTNPPTDEDSLKAMTDAIAELGGLQKLLEKIPGGASVKGLLSLALSKGEAEKPVGEPDFFFREPLEGDIAGRTAQDDCINDRAIALLSERGVTEPSGADYLRAAEDAYAELVEVRRIRAEAKDEQVSDYRLTDPSGEDTHSLVMSRLGEEGKADSYSADDYIVAMEAVLKAKTRQASVANEEDPPVWLIDGPR